jgi:hypothetical protein
MKDHWDMKDVQFLAECRVLGKCVYCGRPSDGKGYVPHCEHHRELITKIMKDAGVE